MKKRFLALLFALSLSVCMCASAFATDTGIDIIDDPLSYYFQNQLLGVQKGTGVTLVCPNGDYKTLYTGGTLVTCPYDGEALELASAGGVIAKKIPEGVGRKDIIGYQDNKGTPNISSDGILYTLAVPYGIVNVDNTAFYTELNTGYNYVLGSSGSGTSGSSSVSFVYTFTVPETGLYYLYNTTGLSLGSYQIFQDGKSWNEYLKSPTIFYRYSSSKTFEKGTKVYLFIYIKGGRWYGGCPFKYSINSIPICYEPLGDTTINNYNKITINNNTWNGNIYTDNSTNLTYIYPQYTTVNEKNETVTNISNTPIIYNNETKQYYTYDQTTKNYYYITYNAQPTPSPSPTPAPTDKPGGSISTPETGKPGGDAGDTTGILAVLVEIRDNMIQGFLDIKAAFVAGFAELSANFTLAIENLNVNIQNIFNKKFPDQSTPETALPSPTPSPSPAPLDPILPETQNLIIPKMNSNTFTDEHGTWIASGSSKYSDVFDFFHAFDRSTSDFWETNAKPSYLQIEIPDPESYYIDGYIMRISKFNNRYAKEWTLQGSDDGKTWDDLDKQTGQNLSDLEEHKYPLTLRKAYKYYRLNMSNYASSMCSLSHFNLLGYDAKDVVTPTPSPTDPPSPSPAPDPGTDPTPVPTPGGGTVPAPGGDSNISGGDDEGLFGWLWDLLKDLVKAILKAIFKILSNILGFLIWIVERVGLLLPFMPAPAIAALGAGVVLIFVIRIIRFIRG